MTSSTKPQGLFSPSATRPGQTPPLGGFVGSQGEVFVPAHTPTWTQVRYPPPPGEALAGVGCAWGGRVPPSHRERQGPAPSRTLALPVSPVEALAPAPPTSPGVSFQACGLWLRAGEVRDVQGCHAEPCRLPDPALQPVGWKPMSLPMPRHCAEVPAPSQSALECSGMHSWKPGFPMVS